MHGIGDRVDAGIAIRHVGRLPSPEIPAYTATDFTLNWRARDAVRLSAGVRNAFDRRHAEYQGFSSISEIPRSVFFAPSWRTP